MPFINTTHSGQFASVQPLIVNGAVVVGAAIAPQETLVGGNGITFPTALTGAILPLGALAGTATAFIGSTQNLGRGFFSSLLGSLHPQSVMPLAIMITVLSSLCLLISGYKYLTTPQSIWILNTLFK